MLVPPSSLEKCTACWPQKGGKPGIGANRNARETLANHHLQHPTRGDIGHRCQFIGNCGALQGGLSVQQAPSALTDPSTIHQVSSVCLLCPAVPQNSHVVTALLPSQNETMLSCAAKGKAGVDTHDLRIQR